MATERLNKVLSHAGISSRRKADELISEGLVTINGKIETKAGVKIDRATDLVEVEGTPISTNPEDKVYILLNKPVGYVSTVNDPENRPTVIDLCRQIQKRIFPIGRLDFHSEGLMVLTNDGNLAYELQHPKFQVLKTYHVKVCGQLSDFVLKSMKVPVTIEKTVYKISALKVIKKLPKKTWLEIKLVEGKNREIRKICTHFKLSVEKLKRVSIGGLELGPLPIGRHKLISKKELLKKIAMANDPMKARTRKKILGGKALERLNNQRQS